jgi:histidine phosphotransfer protein HptB
MASEAIEALVNRQALAQARAELGANFVRILGYFREDGVKSLDQLEAAMRQLNATAMVIPAHTLKGEARQFGADPLADLAETIEVIARNCIETREQPSHAVEHVAQLRPLFEATLTLLEQESTPLAVRRPTMGFGRRQA